MTYISNKIYFRSGDLVTMKHEMPNKPTMLVQSVDKMNIPSKDTGGLLGVTCLWFTNDLALQTHRFNTKDLIHIENA